MRVVSYLLRVVLPDRPGSLGALATALGEVGADIVSLDVVERGLGVAVDDLVVEMPAGGLADALITKAHTVPGAVVESLRPYLGAGDLHRDLELVDALAARPDDALTPLVEHAPGVFRAGWAAVVTQEDGELRVLRASPAAPAVPAEPLPWLPLHSARRLDPEAAWVPPSWRVLGMELVAAPVGSAERVILVGRPGGPRFRPSEVLRLAHLGGIAATVVRSAAAAAAH